MSLSLIIAVYKRVDFLSLVLRSVEKQSDPDFEIIIAEDDESDQIKSFLEEYRKKHSINIKHLSQADKGFRKNRILNQAVRAADSDKLVFIDGDCLIHRHFIKNYKKGITEGVIRAGRRIELSKRHTEDMLQKNRIFGLDFLSLLINGVKYPEKAIYLPQFKALNSGFKHLLGCNWGIMKSDLESINGFDEDYELSGVGEDSDVEWRLLGNGLKIESIVYSALEYHMYHPVHYSQETLDKNLEMLKSKQQNARLFCQNGLIKS